MTVVSVLVYLVYLVILKMADYAQVTLGEALGFDSPTLTWRCVVLALTFPFGLLIHEYGHYLAGALLGQHCRRFVIGPVEFARGASRWKVRLVRMRDAALVDIVPSTFVRFRLQRSICAAGGPLASLLAGLVFIFLSLHAQTQSLFWIWSLSTQWALVGVLNLVPVRFGTARSDGSLLWEAIRGGAAIDGVQRDLLTASSHATPLRLRDWPHDLICSLADIPADPQTRRFNSYLAYLHFLDRGDSQTAGQYLDVFMADWAATDPPEYALEAAYFQAFHRNDSVRAEKWLALEKRDAEPWVRVRAQAAVERAATNSEPARLPIDEALAALKAERPCGAYRYEIERLEELVGAKIEMAVSA